MKKFFMFIITALFLCVLAAACKKDKNDTDGTPVATFAKIDSVIHYRHNSSSEFTKYLYDSQGRVVRILYKYNESDSLFYSGGQVIWKRYWPDGSLQGTKTYTLNSSGLATMLIDDLKKKDNSFAAGLPEIFGFNSKISILRQNLYAYDANEYLVKKTYYDYFNYGDTITYLYTITNGNISVFKGTSTETDTPFSVTGTYSYYTDKQNTIGNQNKGITFLGKQSNNLWKTLVYDYGNNTEPDTVHYWYKFDAKDRVIMSYYSTSYDSYVDSTRYTYKD